jgi:hypothetical protein
VVGVILKLMLNIFEANIGGIDDITKVGEEIGSIRVVNTITYKLDSSKGVLTEAGEVSNPP